MFPVGSVGLAAANTVNISFFAISLGPISWLMISEVYPTKIRGLGMNIATMVCWGSNFIIANTFLSLGRLVTGEMQNPAGEGMLVNPGELSLSMP